ncbi:MAG: hypothetical protein QMD97_02935 [Candidatus Aenigmarchaeota archaeon]|nr:hypothetical protein [Candidatus Aenigmarchaeota archaeon]
MKNVISKNLGCGVSISKRSHVSILNGRKIHGTWFEMELYISKKNLKFFKEFVVGHIAIDHKRDKLRYFLENRYAPGGI